MAFGVSASVRGASDLEQLARALKATGNGQLRKDLLRGLRNGTRPVIDSIRDEMRAELPQSGGLNEWAASGKIASRTRTAGKNAGIRIVGSKAGHDYKAINTGVIRHPVYGGPGWALQNIPAGTWDEGGRRALPKVQADLSNVMQDTAARIARSV